jgi:hypothetical protein
MRQFGGDGAAAGVAAERDQPLAGLRKHAQHGEDMLLLVAHCDDFTERCAAPGISDTFAEPHLGEKGAPHDAAVGLRQLRVEPFGLLGKRAFDPAKPA